MAQGEEARDRGTNSTIDVPDTSGTEMIAAMADMYLGLIPFVGSSMGKAVTYFAQQRVNERMQVFYTAVVDKLKDLQGQVTDGFWKTDSFVTMLLNCADAAVRTHNPEKFEALTNMAVNAALPGVPDDELRHMFVRMLADFSEMHLRLLKLILHPERFDPDFEDWRALKKLTRSGFDEAWQLTEQHVSPRRDLVNACFSELVNRSFLEDADKDFIAAPPSGFQAITRLEPTTLAWDFMAFITAPDNTQGSRA